jgi:UDP-2-acetamido-2,6-beta-L-arabino-hexul-4-ose reductase
MKKVIITGCNGFIGKNLFTHLQSLGSYEIESVLRDDNIDCIREKMKGADIIYHLAGTNRPSDDNEYDLINRDFTKQLAEIAESNDKPYRLIFSSSTQALLDNPYGQSKKEGEAILEKTVKKGELFIYRLPGVYGKWCKPNYNSVVATYCYNIARKMPIHIRDENHLLKIVYIDDVIKAFFNHLEGTIEPGICSRPEVGPIENVTLGRLSDIIHDFSLRRKMLAIPDIGTPFIKKLYSTYLSYLPEDDFSHLADLKIDNRGSLFEILKSDQSGQIFVSTTLPGITRGNHFHHTKTEKFIVIQGEGIIRFRKLDSQEVIEYSVSGLKPEIVDIPTGYTHNITNTGTDVMITLFWANEIFNPALPDTYSREV